jgi:DNA-binding MarR family transcriptional regulator
VKYTIPAIDQRAALALGDIDLIDCHLLQWLFYFCNSKHQALERSKNGTWVSYEFLAAEMPLLGIKQTAVGERMRQLRDKGYITLETNKGVRKTYVGLTEKIERLFGDEPNHANGLGASQTSTMVSPNQRHGLGQGVSKPSGWSDQSHNNPSHKLSAKTDHKKEQQPPASDATIERVRQQLAARGVVRPRARLDIVRHSQNEQPKGESDKDLTKAVESVRSPGNGQKRGIERQTTITQLADSLIT